MSEQGIYGEVRFSKTELEMRVSDSQGLLFKEKLWYQLRANGYEKKAGKVQWYAYKLDGGIYRYKWITGEVPSKGYLRALKKEGWTLHPVAANLLKDQDQ